MHWLLQSFCLWVLFVLSIIICNIVTVQKIDIMCSLKWDDVDNVWTTELSSVSPWLRSADLHVSRADREQLRRGCSGLLRAETSVSSCPQHPDWCLWTEAGARPSSDHILSLCATEWSPSVTTHKRDRLQSHFSMHSIQYQVVSHCMLSYHTTYSPTYRGFYRFGQTRLCLRSLYKATVCRVKLTKYCCAFFQITSLTVLYLHKNARLPSMA